MTDTSGSASRTRPLSSPPSASSARVTRAAWWTGTIEDHVQELAHGHVAQPGGGDVRLLLLHVRAPDLLERLLVDRERQPEPLREILEQFEEWDVVDVLVPEVDLGLEGGQRGRGRAGGGRLVRGGVRPARRRLLVRRHGLGGPQQAARDYQPRDSGHGKSSLSGGDALDRASGDHFCGPRTWSRTSHSTVIV
jgi:hypothetical protein